MKVSSTSYQTIWFNELENVTIIDQRALPHAFVLEELKSLEDVCVAIKDMHVRGAPLIGVTAAFGVYLAMKEGREDLNEMSQKLKATRPTAVDLAWAVDRIVGKIKDLESQEAKMSIALSEAQWIKQESIESCRSIGDFGVEIIHSISQKKTGPVNILTHCNAGWLACIDYGTATAPMYKAHQEGFDIHVWVDETRPRNQGARLTAWELLQEGIPHTVITDNAGGHLMQQGQVDLVIVGTDRTTRQGDVGNKIGTYLKALAAFDNQVPFYVAAPSSSIDWNIRDGVKDIPIESRADKEVKYIQGLHQGEVKSVLLSPADSPALNYAFDVTPARLVTGIITERGVAKANEESLTQLFSEFK